jgi:hypothetical protein
VRLGSQRRLTMETGPPPGLVGNPECECGRRYWTSTGWDLVTLMCRGTCAAWPLCVPGDYDVVTGEPV